MRRLKFFIKHALVHSKFLFKAANILTKNTPRVLVYHRFCKSEVNHQHLNCIDQDTFEWQLKQLQESWRVIRLKDYWKFMQEGKPLGKVAIITVDDGYRDFYEIGFPLLQKYKLNATFFPTAEFVNGNIWLWPDRLRYMLDNTSSSSVTVNLNGKQIQFSLSSREDHVRVWYALNNACISFKNQRRRNFLLELEKILNVPVPDQAPLEYAPVSWDQLGEMFSNGIEIGCHTMTHPILSKVSAKRLWKEVVLAKKEIESRLDTKIVSFCYPNSAPGDINQSVIDMVKEAGFKIAVFGTDLNRGQDQFQIPRISVQRDRVDFLWKLCGMEKLTTFIFKG